MGTCDGICLIVGWIEQNKQQQQTQKAFPNNCKYNKT